MMQHHRTAVKTHSTKIALIFQKEYDAPKSLKYFFFLRLF